MKKSGLKGAGFQNQRRCRGAEWFEAEQKRKHNKLFRKREFKMKALLNAYKFEVFGRPDIRLINTIQLALEDDNFDFMLKLSGIYSQHNRDLGISSRELKLVNDIIDNW